ncbi:sporulation protein YabP [Keratinibaculum paraultunense]|uniref:Sporulation protein YabP n=1 Tax=Keratinibaculum paraultunense TaxID=1278232 RepID=A0A4R3KSC3_9FIRM|nr:sporulation protein YabP [Keratinibaculum paraultunense]QQY79489.1 sporulation protein YabP [Keratinibaculum paraultunense]TCS88016.1 sporulation protein YabP [Keratinibaculum paraultunense]
MAENRVDFKTQNILVENRNKVTITGVEQVESFNESTIILMTVKGGMTIKGEGLNVGKLNLEDGNIKIDGIINGIFYNSKDSSQKGNLIGKIFK